MTQLPFVPNSQDRDLGLSGISVAGQSPAMDMDEDAIKRDNGSVPSGMVQGNNTEPYTETDSTKRDVSNIQESTKANFDVEQSHVDGALDAQHTSLTPAGVDRRGTPCLDFPRPSQPFPDSKPDKIGITDDRASNIVIFGETGVGKSSVINLIADEDRAHTSNDALGCTFQHERHTAVVHGIRCALWDTTGLDEGNKGIVPAENAEANLRELIEKLARSGGIHLVIYCIRGTRLTTALKRNYDLFYVTVCRKDVPVVLVVTGLEYRERSMETWWHENEAILRRCGMRFDAHACITTLNINDPVIQRRRLDSQKRLHDLIVTYAGQRPWKIEPSLIPWATAMFRNLPTNNRTIRRVVIYDPATPSGASWRKMGDQQFEYEWVHVDVIHPDEGLVPPGVLVFYTSSLVLSGISPDDHAALTKFYEIAGGNNCSVIVVLRDCHEPEIVKVCWDIIASQHDGMRAHCIADTPEALDAMVERLCVGHTEVRSTSSFWQTIVQALWKFF